MGLLGKILSIIADKPVVPVKLSKLEKRLLNGRMTPMPESITRWSLAQLEAAIHSASNGDLRLAGQLVASTYSDGVVRGVLSTRTDGLVRLPRKFKGRDDIVKILEGDETTKGLFDQMLPPGELVKMAADGIMLGVSVGRMVPVVSADGSIPAILHRLPPEFLTYRWDEDEWYFQSQRGPIKITPGKDGWVLYLAGGQDEPWEWGAWKAVGRAYIIKEHALYNRQNYAAKIAFPARVGYMPENSTERNRIKFIDQIIRWTSNTSFALPQGWDVKLVESNGRGYEIYSDQIKSADQEIIITLNGQIVTTLGTTGFGNGNVNQSVRMDLIQGTAESLSEFVNSQILKPWVNQCFGADAMSEAAEVSWDTTPPEDTAKDAATLVSLLNSSMVQASMQASGMMVDPEMLREKYGILMVPAAQQAPEPALPPQGGPLLPEASTAPEGPPSPDYAASLAEAMTAAQMTHCEHGRANMCSWCGVERQRGVEVGEDGTSKYILAWRPIVLVAPAEPQAAPIVLSPKADATPKKKRTLKKRTNLEA